MPICFMDRTFCSSDCVNRDCPRNLTPELRERAQKWWAGQEGEPNVSLAPFRDGCGAYLPPEKDVRS